MNAALPPTAIDVEFCYARALGLLQKEGLGIKRLVRRFDSLNLICAGPVMEGLDSAERTGMHIAADLAALTLALTQPQNDEEARTKRAVLADYSARHAGHGALAAMLAAALAFDAAAYPVAADFPLPSMPTA